jgi:hypothetical protein
VLLAPIKARLEANHFGTKWHVFVTVNKCNVCSDLLHFVVTNHRYTVILFVEKAELCNVIESCVIANLIEMTKKMQPGRTVYYSIVS